MNERIYETTTSTDNSILTSKSTAPRLMKDTGFREDNNKRFICRRNHFVANFWKAKERGQLFTTESGEHRITVWAKKAGEGIVLKKNIKEQRRKKNDIPSFTELKTSTDYEYSMTEYGIKDNIIIKEKSDVYRYRFILQCEHVTPQIVELENRILFLSNDTGNEVFFIPASFMMDAIGIVSTDVYYELTPQPKGVFQLTVTADGEWVNAKERVFPVIIYPQISRG